MAVKTAWKMGHTQAHVLPVERTQTLEILPGRNTAEPAPLLTTDQTAEYLHVSARTVKNLLADGRLAYIKIGRATRIQRQDIDGYIARNRRKQRNGLR